MNPNDYVHSCVTGCHDNSLFHLVWTKKSVVLDCFLQHIHLNVYAEFESEISYMMFLHDYQLACEISTVRTIALSLINKIARVRVYVTFTRDKHLSYLAIKIACVHACNFSQEIKTSRLLQ